MDEEAFQDDAFQNDAFQTGSDVFLSSSAFDSPCSGTATATDEANPG